MHCLSVREGSGKKHLGELKKSFQKRPISQQNILINMCETYNLDLSSKSHFNPSICLSCVRSWLFSDFGVPKSVSLLFASAL
jgi:hypothetical protein